MKNILGLRKTVGKLKFNCVAIDSCLDEIKKISSKNSILSTGKRALRK